MERLKAWARNIRRDVLALYLAGRDPRVPRLAKVVALATAAYAFSPIDLIPDFIPVLGYLDDLVIVPLGILLAVRLMPAGLMQELREEAARRSSRSSPRSWIAASFIVCLWLAICAASVWKIFY